MFNVISPHLQCILKIQSFRYNRHSDEGRNEPDLEAGMYCLRKHLPQLGPLHGFQAVQWGLPSFSKGEWASPAGPEGSEEAESSMFLSVPRWVSLPLDPLEESYSFLDCVEDLLGLEFRLS